MAQMKEFCADLKDGAGQNEESLGQEGILEQMNNSGCSGSGVAENQAVSIRGSHPFQWWLVVIRQILLVYILISISLQNDNNQLLLYKC